MSTLKPVIGITMGDPSGIGPEIAVKAVTHEHVTALCRPLLIGGKAVLADAGLGLDIDVLEPEKQRLLDLGRFNFAHHQYMLGVYSHFVLFGVGYVASLFFRPDRDVRHLTIYGWLEKRAEPSYEPV
jgi:hypothetical protein